MLWVGPSAGVERVGPSRERLASTPRARPRRAAPAPQDRARPRPGSRAGRRGEEAPSRVRRRRPATARAASLDGCPPASTRSRTRRAASARRRLPSTSPPASPRPASAACSSTSTRRRTRPRVSASARTASPRTICWTACRCASSPGRRRSRTSTWCPPSPSSRPRPCSSPRSRAASGISRRRSPAPPPTATRSSSSTARPRSGPLTVNALAAADRVIVPVQAEYYALEGLSQLLGSINLVKARLNPRLAVAGILLTMVDGRTRLAAEVEHELRRHFGDARLHDVRAPLGAPRRGAEPRASRDRLRPPLVRRAGVLEGGDGACRTFLRRPAAASAAASRC